MGIYTVKCKRCLRSFEWWSGTMLQLCPQCVKEDGGGHHRLFVKAESKKTTAYAGSWVFVSYNKAKSLEEAIDFLVNKGIDRDRITTDRDGTEF